MEVHWRRKSGGIGVGLGAIKWFTSFLLLFYCKHLEKVLENYK